MSLPTLRHIGNRSSAWLRLGVLVAVLGGLLGTTFAQTRNERRQQAAQASTSATTATDPFDVFRVIGDRNIFDPDRQPRVRRNAASEIPAPADDVISFVGTLQYEKGLFAFFDGSSSAYRTTLPTGGIIAGFSVGQITPHSVSLTANERLLTLRMGESLRRSEGSDWTVNTLPTPSAEISPITANTPTRPSPPTIPSDASATLRRLMEQRQKQLKE
ncbi:MAG TPA: hypothetical protein PLN52_14080 [Opitutaceae bacterium]|nr:hypothetical protein [Opitutaceae bacterium]